MLPRTRRLYFVLFILVSLAAAAAISLYALKDNVSFFYPPAQVKVLAAARAPEISGQRIFRVGGLVKKGSLQSRSADLFVTFEVTDLEDDLRVEYKGILPDLFREEQGVVAKGFLRDDGVFEAQELLAKHDEKYMPPEVAKILDKGALEKRSP